jgi:hypothetical protein
MNNLKEIQTLLMENPSELWFNIKFHEGHYVVGVVDTWFYKHKGFGGTIEKAINDMFKRIEREKIRDALVNSNLSEEIEKTANRREDAQA